MVPRVTDPYGFHSCRERHDRAKEHMAYVRDTIQGVRDNNANPINLGPTTIRRTRRNASCGERQSVV
jgi:hypothetical protein